MLRLRRTAAVAALLACGVRARRRCPSGQPEFPLRPARPHAGAVRRAAQHRQLRRFVRAHQPLGADDRRRGVPGRAVRTRAAGRDRAAQQELSGVLPQRRSLRRRDGPVVGIRAGHAAVADAGPHRPAHLARPPDALDGSQRPAGGQGQGRQDEDLRLLGAAASGRSAGGDQGHALLGRRARRRDAHGGDRRAGAARRRRRWRSSWSSAGGVRRTPARTAATVARAGPTEGTEAW